MTVTLPPKGTRGTEIPGFAKALMKAGSGLGNLIFNMMGDRMKMQGQPLILLTTVGAKSGSRGRRCSAGSMTRSIPEPGSWSAPTGARPGTRDGVTTWSQIPTRPGRQSTREDQGPGGFGRRGEYQVAWDRIVSLAPGYGSYLRRPIATCQSSGLPRCSSVGAAVSRAADPDT